MREEEKGFLIFRFSFCFSFFPFDAQTHLPRFFLSPPSNNTHKHTPGVAADVAPVSANSHPPLPGLARAPAPAESARAAASLLLRLDALAAARNRGSSSLLPVGSAPLLRALASAGDGPLLSAYERCRSWTDDAAVAAELARAGERERKK